MFCEGYHGQHNASCTDSKEALPPLPALGVLHKESLNFDGMQNADMPQNAQTYYELPACVSPFPKEQEGYKVPFHS